MKRKIPRNTRLCNERLGFRHHGVLEDASWMMELLRGFDQLLQLLKRLIRRSGAVLRREQFYPSRAPSVGLPIDDKGIRFSLDARKRDENGGETFRKRDDERTLSIRSMSSLHLVSMCNRLSSL